MDTMDEDEDEDDSDFAPGEGDELLMETDNDDEEETPTDTEGAAPRSLQIAYDSGKFLSVHIDICRNRCCGVCSSIDFIIFSSFVLQLLDKS